MVPLSKTVGLLLLMIAGIASCGGDIAIPEPAKPRRYRERRLDQARPQHSIEGWCRSRVNRRDICCFQRRSISTDACRRYMAPGRAPNVVVRKDGPYIGHGRLGWYVYLRCPAPLTIPVSARIEISFDACRITTYEPGPEAVLNGYHLAAQEGVADSHMEPGYTIVRKVGRQP